MDIKKLRKGRRWIREKLAKKIGVTKMTIYRWEIGESKPHKTFQEKLEKLLGV